MRKKAITRLLHTVQVRAYVQGAVIRSCHHFAQMCIDYREMEPSAWTRTYRGGADDDAAWSDSDFLQANARRIEEMARAYRNV